MKNAMAKAIHAFQLTNECNTILFSWYYKGFELLRRYLVEAQPKNGPKGSGLRGYRQRNRRWQGYVGCSDFCNYWQGTPNAWERREWRSCCLVSLYLFTLFFLYFLGAPLVLGLLNNFQLELLIYIYIYIFPCVAFECGLFTLCACQMVCRVV